MHAGLQFGRGLASQFAPGTLTGFGILHPDPFSASVFPLNRPHLLLLFSVGWCCVNYINGGSIWMQPASALGLQSYNRLIRNTLQALFVPCKGVGAISAFIGLSFL